MLDCWGTGLTISTAKQAKLDEVVASVQIRESEGFRRIIPLFGRIFRFPVQEDAEVRLEVHDKFSLPNGKTKMILKDSGGNILIDARLRPVEKHFAGKTEIGFVRSWLKGVEAFK
jgi:hypothetical protein